MDSTLTTYITLVVISGVLNLFLGIYVYLKRHLYSNLYILFILNMAAKTIYCFGYAFSLTSSTLAQIRFWSVVQYCGMPFAPALGVLFVLKYLGYKIKKWHVATLMAFPALALLANATNEFHHLHYKVYKVHETLGAPYNYIEVGPSYIVMGTFILVCFIISLLLLFSRLNDAGKSYRTQIWSLIMAHLIPMVTSFLYLIGVTPPGIDPVPMVVGITSILMWWAIESTRLLTIMPVAKDAIFQSISDGVLVLDKPGRLVEYNTSCQRMFPGLNRSLFGQPLEAIWKAMFGPSSRVPEPGDQAQELEVNVAEPEERVYQIRLSPLIESENRSSKGTVMIISDITEFKRMQRMLERHAYYDDLTQILNRRAFFERCEKSVGQAEKENFRLTAILFDIDHFKQINDTYGHHAGDQVLLHVARTCEACLPPDALFARYGGEEFVIALFGRAAKEGCEIAEQMRQKIAEQPVWVDGVVIHATSSFGVADTIEPSAGSLQRLLHAADMALYEAKRGGRNQVRTFIPQSAC